MKALFQDLQDFRDGNRPFKIIFVDPLAHSFLQNPHLPDEDKNAKR